MILSLALLLFPAVRCQDNTAIDFSGGEVDLETGVVCVEVEEEREVVEQDSEQQCTQQIVRKRDFSRCTHSYLIYSIIANTEICCIYLNVPSYSQCYQSYKTQYRDIVRKISDPISL